MLSAQTKGAIFGWQSTQCSKREGLFTIVPQSSPFIQLLHTGSCHWLTTSNVNIRDGGCYRDVIGIYDSGQPSTVHSEITRSVCAFYKCPSDVLRFDIMNVMAQPNSYDCGIHAIAYATELSYGFDPVVCDWDVQNMRQHLLYCFKSGTLTRFPKVGQRKIRFGTCVRKSTAINIFCICRTINDESKPMIECVRCLKWLHKECMGLDIDQSYSSIK